jgi:hypothetical protein
MGGLLGMLGLGGGTGGTDFNVNQLYKPEQLQQALQQAQEATNMQKQLALGQGPNPALEMLRQSTGQNVANQAALMAGQRGAAGNVGMMARQAANIGTQAQQQGIGQAAQLQAQQQQEAMRNLAQNTLAQQQLQQQAGMNYQNVMGGLTEKRVGQQPGAIGGLLQGLGKAVFGAEGGEIPEPQHLFVGGAAAALPMMEQAGAMEALPVVAGAGSGGSGGAKALQQLAQFGKGLQGDKSGNILQGSLLGKSTDEPSSVARYLSQMPKMAGGGSVGTALKAGGKVPGTASVPGNSLKNDTVHAMLSPGEVVIPRTVMQSGDPVRGSAEFVAALLAKKGMRS